MAILKAGTRPGLQPIAEILSSRLGLSRAGCPVCQLSTRSHPLHSTARVTVEKKREDHVARIEFFGPGGVLEKGRPSTTFRKYASHRKLEDPAVALTLPSLLSTFSEMTSRSEQPNRQAYLSLLKAASDYSIARGGTGGHEVQGGVEGTLNNPWKEHGEVGLGWKVAWCAWKDAAEGGIDLGIQGFDLLLRAAQPHPKVLLSLLSQIPHHESLASSLTTATFGYLLQPALLADNIEMVLSLYSEMRRRNVNPPVNRTAQIIALVCEFGLPRLAMEMAERAEKDEVRGVTTASWVDILRCSAESQYLEGVEKAWQKAVVKGRFTPDEGLLVLILHTAGRWGSPQLATDAISRLGDLNIRPQEHHLAPLLEAFCVKGMLPDAMEVLDIMRTTAGIEPTLHTAQPIVKIISADSAILDAAYFALEALKTSGKPVDVAALNAVLAAAERLGDLGRAVAVYQQAGKLGVRLNTETYNCLLGACIQIGAKPQGDLLLKEMQNPKRLPGDTVDPAPIPMDSTTYTKLIHLALTQKSYEEAFFYLEKMKDANHRPPLEVYEALVRRCLRAGDDRYKLVLEEMRSGGYKPSSQLIQTVQRHLDPSAAERDDRRVKHGGKGKDEGGAAGRPGGRRRRA